MKKTTLIFLTTFFFFVGITTTKAYGEEVSPMLDLSTLDISFDNIDENDPRYSNLISARNFVKENNISNYIITPFYYNNSCNSTSCTKTKNAFASKQRLLNGSSPESVLDLSNAISLIVFDNSVSTMNTDIAKSNYYYYFEYTISHSYNYKMIYFYDNGNSMYGDLDYNFRDDYLQHSIMSSTSYKKFILPYLESDIKGTYFTKNYVGRAMSRTTYYSSVKYNDLIYNEGDLFINFNNNSFAIPISDSTFHETIYTTDYNSIEFEFDLASLPLYSEGNTFNLDFEFKSVTQSGEDETIKFSLPYYTLTQLVDSTTEEGASITLTKEDIEKYFKQDNYTYTYSNSEQIRYLNDLGVLEKNYTKYKITLPLEFSYASFVDVYVKSNLDFEVIRNYSSSYDESVVSDIETIDLTNKYGVVFIPLVKNGSIHFPFKSVGHFFVQHRDSYNKDFNILSTTTVGYCDEYHKNDENYTCADLSGLYSFTFKEGFDNQVLTFINRNYENDINSFVEYHSNSFNYCVLDTPTSTCNIINPNTNEEVNLTLKDYFDYKTESNNESFFEMFSNAFNRFKTAILSIFDYISIYFEYLPSILKDFYIVIFIFVILAVIVKFLI